MKRGRPSSIHEPSTFRSGNFAGATVRTHQKLRPAKKPNCPKRPGCPWTALNIQRRVLRYASDDQIHTIVNRRQISLQERNDTWINVKDFRRMQKETATMMERMEADSKLELSFSSLSEASNNLLDVPPITTSFDTTEEAVVVVPPSPSSNSVVNDTNPKDELPESESLCLRGLEQHTKLYLATKQSVQRLMHETVAKIRGLEQKDGKDYTHVLAQLCQVCSATAVTNARVLGERDAQEAGY